jgi:hypothetical protein
MDEASVPQHALDYYEGRQRACYAKGRDGRYKVVFSSGWNVEAIVNRQANRDIEAQITEALTAVRSGAKSPLYFHMVERQMTVSLLAAHTGMFRWRIKRHFRPAVFAGLPPRILTKYALALGRSVAEVSSVPAAIV